MTVRNALQQASARLRQAKISSSALDAEVLLACAFGRDRAWLYGHPEHALGRKAARKFENFIKRRARREPVAYITGHKEFYGLDFLVNKNVLIPRPETELIVEDALREAAFSEIKNKKLKIKNVVVDVGTGSGAIVISIAKTCNLKPVTFFATDLSTSALAVARANARRHGVDKQITFVQGNLLEPLKDVILNETQWSEGSRSSRALRDSSPAAQNDGLVVVANLPYLPTSEWRATAPEIREWEPRAALDGGRDGLKYYRELFRQLHQFVILNEAPAPERSSVRSFTPRSEESLTAHMRVRSFAMLRMTIFCELCPHQVQPFKQTVRKYFPRAKFRVMKDLAGKDRVAAVRV